TRARASDAAWRSWSSGCAGSSPTRCSPRTGKTWSSLTTTRSAPRAPAGRWGPASTSGASGRGAHGSGARPHRPARRRSHAWRGPVVATLVPGTREAVRHGSTGLLVEPDDADSLAGALAFLIGDPETRARMGAEGRRVVLAEFDERTVIHVLRDLYAAWLQG